MKKGLGIGIQDYRTLIEENGYFVDKTMMIAQFLSDITQVTLITRPRRFGKTLNMSMLAEFLDITKDSKTIFEGTNIMNTEYRSYLNQYPVIFLSFKDAKGDKQNAIKLLKKAILTEYRRYEPILKQLSGLDKADYDFVIQSLMNRMDGDLTAVNDSLQLLSRFLFLFYHKKVILLVDEYDTPFIEAHMNHYYDEIHSSLAALLSTALKGNEYLKKALLTGIQRIAKENIFSGLNNIAVYGVDKQLYSEFFGLTKEETMELLSYYDIPLTKDVEAMYDGYRIGAHDIYNPWSIINYAKEHILTPYWLNTSTNKMIKDALQKCKVEIADEFELLILNGQTVVNAQLETSYYEDNTASTLWALLINSGYLTILERLENSDYLVKIPNEEVKSEFKDLTAHYLEISDKFLNELHRSFREGNIENIAKQYRKFLLHAVSYHDLISENSYHMLLLGLCAFLYDSYNITSNREAGSGRYDITLESKKESSPSYILEFKYTKDSKANLHALAQQAVTQIIEHQYDSHLHGNVMYIGLAHRGKDIEIAYQTIMK